MRLSPLKMFTWDPVWSVSPAQPTARAQGREHLKSHRTVTLRKFWSHPPGWSSGLLAGLWHRLQVQWGVLGSEQRAVWRPQQAHGGMSGWSQRQA